MCRECSGIIHKIEGIETIKSEIYSSLKDDKKSSKKNNKLEGIIKKYKDIMEKNFKDTQHIYNLSTFKKYMMKCLKILKKVETIN